MIITKELDNLLDQADKVRCKLILEAVEDYLKYQTVTPYEYKGLMRNVRDILK